MKKFSFVWIVLLVIISSCNKNEHLKQEVVGDNKYASGFTIETRNDGYDINILSPWMGASEQTFRYVLKRELGEEEINSIDCQTFKIPLKKVAVMSTSHLAMIEALDHMSAIVGISEKQYVNSQAFWQHQDTCDVIQIGYENSLDIENLIKLNPDAVFLYGLSSAVLPTAEQIIRLGIPVVFVSEFNELYPLAKLEWIRFFGCFFDCLSIADSIVDSKVENYQKIKNIVLDVDYKPTVLLGLPWKDHWNIPGAITTTATYIRDAGATYVFEQLNEKINYSLGIEEVFMSASQADYWVNVGFAENLSYIYNIDKRFVNFKAVEQKHVYNNNKIRNKSGGNDYMESGVMYPDMILADLISIFHPKLMPNYIPKYYYRLK